jgi:predicted ATPase/DNA-binding winged helix-turn-helix (wHTH) protein
VEQTEHPHSVGDVFEFGQFRLFPASRLLIAANQPVRLGARAFDILLALVERAGEPVSKDTLVAVAWPHTLVEESNLRVHIAALRKLFQGYPDGGRCIVNIAGLGYLFAVPVMRARAALPPEPDQRQADRDCMPSIVGRGALVASVLARIGEKRCMTITGPAGVGKSCVALCVAQEARLALGLETVFVDLSQGRDAALLPEAIARALKVELSTDNPVASLMSALGGRSLLMVLDTCEPMAGAVAALAGQILQLAQGVTILATSREPLMVQGEWVCRLPTLAFPAAGQALTAAQALTYPAVQLFVERARDSCGWFEFDDGQAARIAALCAHLDGLPLAIELAASRLDLFGQAGVRGEMEERLLLSIRHGGAAPRQETLRAALDWSYALLSDREQAVMQRLSIFAGPFSLRSAVHMAIHGGMSESDVLDAMASLTAKSLVVTQANGPLLLYRLFHVTRTYCAEKQDTARGMGPARRRHAMHLHDVLSEARQRWDCISREQWFETYGHLEQDVRKALDWSLSPEGDAAFADGLLAVSQPFAGAVPLAGGLPQCHELARVNSSVEGAPPLFDRRLRAGAMRPVASSRTRSLPVAAGV